MKTKFFLLAIPCFIMASCNNSADKAAKAKTDSIAAAHHFDSLMNASKMMYKQDSIDNAKVADSTKKADSAKGQK